MVYRSNEHVLDAARAEERELTALTREGRARRVRAAATMGALFVTMLAAVQVVARSPAFAPLPTLHCHKIIVQYEQTSGTPPPPLSWEVCERR